MTERSSKRRKVPKGAKSLTSLDVVWSLAPFGSQRSLGFREVWDSAPLALFSSLV
jgi:hypothetical protein